MAQVILEDVTKRYEGSDVLTIKETTVQIKDKEFMVLVGPSGCGKSTTLRMVAGLEEITSGTIKIGETVVNDLPPKDRDIAMVFQNYALYPHMNVYDNMAFGLRLRKTPKKEIDERVKDAAEILGIDDLLDRKPKQLSGGQRQRVALGRAIVRQPKVFLMDEPLSNLDAKLRVHMRAEISKLHKRLKTTIVYVTHDQVEAMTMGDRILIYNEGIVQQVDTPQEVYDHPRNMFVAGFIGSPSMNFIDAMVKEESGEMYLVGSDFKVKLPKERKEALASYLDKPVVMGIRPEDIYIKSTGKIKPTADNTMEPIVDVVEPMGAEVFLYLKIGEKLFIARIEPSARPEFGKPFPVVWDVHKIHVFDKDSHKTVF